MNYLMSRSIIFIRIFVGGGGCYFFIKIIYYVLYKILDEKWPIYQVKIL